MARYFDIVSPAGVPDKLIIVCVNSRQPSRLYPELLVIWLISWQAVHVPCTSGLPSPSGNWACWPCAVKGPIIRQSAHRQINVIDSLDIDSLRSQMKSPRSR